MCRTPAVDGGTQGSANVLLAYELGELARPVLPGKSGVVHPPQAMVEVGGSKGDAESRCQPQAVRGDAPALTAAAFAALTGFTRSRPTGLGRTEARFAEGRDQLRLPRASGIFPVKSMSNVVHRRFATWLQTHADRIEAELPTHRGMLIDPRSCRTAHQLLLVS